MNFGIIMVVLYRYYRYYYKDREFAWLYTIGVFGLLLFLYTITFLISFSKGEIVTKYGISILVSCFLFSIIYWILMKQQSFLLVNAKWLRDLSRNRKKWRMYKLILISIISLPVFLVFLVFVIGKFNNIL